MKIVIKDKESAVFLVTLVIFVIMGSEWMLQHHWFIAIYSIICIYSAEKSVALFAYGESIGGSKLYCFKILITVIAIFQMAANCPASIQVVALILLMLSLCSSLMIRYLYRHPEIAIRSQIAK